MQGASDGVLDDKVTWKICESVHLGMDAIYLSFFTLKKASDVFFKGHADGLYKSFEKASAVAYRFELTEETIRHYREEILPTLPKGWWAEKKPWMEM